MIRIDDPVVSGAIFHISIPVQSTVRGLHGVERHTEICPTFDLNPKTNYKNVKPTGVFGEERERLSVRYFLRFMIQDAQGNDYWNTQVRERERKS
mmetsp:Transcript_32007/g.32635  ORF Transcript_32007/g.32635 Transcript_32007/m.32635 type:complete len:95 (+) Transcript_32007:1-285(+)